MQADCWLIQQRKYLNVEIGNGIDNLTVKTRMNSTCRLFLHRVRELAVVHELNQRVITWKLGSRRSAFISKKLERCGFFDCTKAREKSLHLRESFVFANLRLQIKPDVVVDHGSLVV